MGGSAIAFADILGLSSWREHEAALPNDAIVFFDHQGYQCFFLRASEGENPPVWHFLQRAEPGHGTPKISHASLIDLLESVAQHEFEAHRRDTAASRRRAFVDVACPSCDGPLLVVEHEYFTGRDVALCIACERRSWRSAGERTAAFRPR